MYRITAEQGNSSTVIHGRTDRNARVIGGWLKEYVNEIPMFDFRIYPNNPGYEMTEPALSHITMSQRSTGEDIFIGRIYSVRDIMDENGMIYRSVTCEGELAYLQDIVVGEQSFSSGTLLSVAVERVLNAYNNGLPSGSGKAIVFGGGGNDAALTEAIKTDYMTAFELIAKLCDLCSCEFRLEYIGGTRYLMLSRQFGSQVNTDIALSINLRSLERTVELPSLITRFVPLGNKNSNGTRLTIASVNGSNGIYLKNTDLISRYGIIDGYKYYDIDWSEQVTGAATKLKNAGQRDFDKILAREISFKLGVLDLSVINGSYDELRLYNRHRVITKLQGIDDTVRITGRELPIDEPQNTVLQFGVRQQTLSDMLAGK